MSRLTSKHFLHAKLVLLSTLVVFCIFGGITGNSSSQSFAHVEESDVTYFSQSDKTIIHSHVSIFESFDIYGTLYDDNNDGNNNDNSQSGTKTNTLTTISKHTTVFINDGDYSLSKQQLDYAVEYVTDQIQDNALLLTRSFMKSFSVLESFDISLIASNIISPMAYADTDNIQSSLPSENVIPWSDDINYFSTELFTEIGDIRINPDGTISASLVNMLVLASLLPVSFVVFVGRYNVKFNTLEKNIYIDRNSTLKKSLTMFFVIILLSSSIPMLNFSNPSAMLEGTEMVLPEAYAQVDSTPPTFVSSALHVITGVFTITFDKIINHTTIDPTAIHIKGNDVSTGEVTLSASELDTTANTDTISFTLNPAHLDLVNALNTPALYIGADAVQDIDRNDFVGTVFDVTTATSVDSFSVLSQETSPSGLAFSPDGTKMFVVGVDHDNVHEYDLSAAFDVSTATFTGNSFSVSPQETSPFGLAFSPNGTKMFVVGFGSDNVHEYDLSAAFDVSTANFTGNSFPVTTQDYAPISLAFSPDGTKMFVTGFGSRSVYEYTLSTAFDVSTADFTGNSFSVLDEAIYPYGLAFSPDGTKMFVTDSGSRSVYEYTLSTAFDVSTANVTTGNTFSVKTEVATPTGLTFSPDGTKMFVVGHDSSRVHEYNLSTAFDITLFGNPKVSSAESLSISDNIHIHSPIDSTFGNNVGFDDTTPWIDDLSFQYRRVFTIDADNVPGSSNLADFAVMISLNATQGFDTIMQSHMDDNGSDLRFADNLGNLLPYEIEQYDESANQMIVWVKSNSTGISSSIDTSIYMYYGNFTAAPATNPASVWNDDYKAVFHFDDNVDDSTINDNDGTNSGSINTGGLIGNGRDFDGINDRIYLPNDSLNFNGGDLTLSLWMNTDTTSGGHVLIGKSVDASHSNPYYRWLLYQAVNQYSMRIGATAQNLATAIPTDTWKYYVGAFDTASNEFKLYVDGNLIDTVSTSQELIQSSRQTTIGGRDTPDNNPNAESYDGQLDEVRISNAVKSAHWIKTEFNNQNSPYTFYDIGDEIKLGTIFDAVTLADTVIRSVSYDTIHLTESLLLSDDTIVMSNNMVQPIELLFLSDDTIIMSNNMVQLTESLLLSDGIDVMSNNMVQLTESLLLSDDTIIMSNNMVHLTESLFLSDGVGIMSNNMVQLTESLLLSDDTIIMSNNMVHLTESLFLSDGVGIMSNNMVHLTESLSLSDGVGIMSNNMVHLTESLLLSDTTGIMSNNMVQPTESLSLSDNIRIQNPIGSTFGNNVGFDDTTPWIEDLSFQYRRVFTIDAGNVPGPSNLADFAVMISLNATQGFDTIMQSHMNNDGSDLRFADNLGNLLPYEIEQYDESANQMIVWVKSNSTGISSSIDTNIYMYYGNFAAISAADSASVWNDDYKAVFHFDDNVDDSTINDNDGTNSGSINTGGLIGNGRDFDGINDRIYLPNDSLNFNGGDLTLSLWMNTDTTSGGHVLIGKSVDASHSNPYYRWLLYQAVNQYSMRIGATAQNLATAIPTDTWKYYVGAFDTASNEFKLYVDGNLIDTVSTSQELIQSSRQTTIGGRDTPDNNPNAESYDGQLDEVRISNAVKSAHWIKTEFNNQNSPYTFYDIGDEIKLGTIFDAVTLADTTIEILSHNIQLTESLSLSDTTGIMSNNMVQPTESLSLSDNIRIQNPIDSTFGNNVGFDDTTPWIEDLSFQYRRVFTIDADNVPGSSNLADFAVMISLNATQGFDTIMQSHMNNDGSDLRFADNLGNLLPYEIEQYDESANQMIVWVKSNSTGISSSIDTNIYMYYGNFAAISAADSASVWNDDYKAVFHFDDNVDDSTINDNDGTNSGSINTGGLIGNGRDFDGINDRIYLPNDSLNFNGGDLTLSLWMNTDTTSGGHVLIGKSVDASHSNPYYRWLLYQAVNQYSMRIGATAQNLATAIPTDTWKYYVGAFDTASNEFKLYVDGNLIDTVSTSQELIQSSRQTTIGGRDTPDNNPNAESYDGQLDEVRISNAVKSAHWIKTEFNNQNSPYTFYDIGDEIKLGTIFDAVTLADTVIRSVSYDTIHLTESLSLSEGIDVMSNNMVQPIELLFLSDDTIIMSNNMVQLTESLLLSDGIDVMSNNMVHLTESLSLSDDTIIMSNNMVHLTESLLLSDGIDVMSNNMVHLTESLLLSDDTTVMSNNMVHLTESLLLSDDTTVMSNNMVQPIELLFLSDGVGIMSDNMVQLTESLLLSDGIDVMSNNMVHLTESLLLSDDTTVMSNNMVQPIELLFLSDGVGIMSDNMVQPTESLSLSDDTTVMSNNMVQPIELLFLSDGVGIMSDNMVQLTESLLLSDGIDVMSNNMVHLTESLLLSDDTTVMSNNMIQLTESLSLSDDTIIMSDNMIHLTESLSLSDDTTVMSNNMVQPIELLFLSDGVGIMSDNMIQLTESLLLSDGIDVMSNNMVHLTESLLLSDDTTVMSNNMVQPIELLFLSDGVGIMSDNMVQLTESLLLSDGIDVMSNNMVHLTESLLLSDDTTVMSNNMVQPIELLFLSDGVGIMSDNMVQLTESLLLSDGIDVMSNNMVHLTESLLLSDDTTVMSNNMVQPIELLFLSDGVGIMSDNMVQLTESLLLSDGIDVMSNNMVQLTESLPVADSVVVMSNNMIQLTESLPVADSVVVMSNNMIQLTESLPVADSVVVMSNNMIQLTESLPVADSVVVMSNNMIQLTESLSLSDDTIIMSDNMVHLTESLLLSDDTIVMSNNMVQPIELLFLSDGVGIMSDNMVQLTESLLLSDGIDVMSNNMVHLTESLLLSDDTIVMSNNMVQPIELLFLSDGVGIMSDNMVQLTELLSLSDDTIVMSNNMVQLTESLPVADSVVVMSNNMVQLTESLSLSDDTIVMSNNMVQLTESLPVADSVVVMSNNMIQLTESLPVADSVVVMSNNMVQLTESLSLSDDTIIMSNNMIQLTESLSLSDDTIIMSNNMIQLTESLLLSDDTIIMSNNMVQLTESLSLSDDTIIMSNNMIQLTESLSLSDDTIIMSNNMIQLTESLSLSDDTIIMSNNMIQLTELLSLSDDTIIMSNNMIQLTESLPVADSVVVMSNNMIQLTESLPVADSVVVMSNNMIQLTESLPVADSVVVMSNNMIQLTESLPVADSVVVMSNNMIQLTESLPVADSVVVMSNNMIQLTESLSLSDDTIIMSNNMIQLTESLSLSDDTIIMSNNMIQLTESLSLSDDTIIMSNNMIQLTESLPVADSVVVMSNNMIQLTESLPVADSVVVMSNNMIQLTESLPVADSVVVMSNNMIQLTESLLLSDDTIIMSNNMIQLTESLPVADSVVVMSNNMIQLTESLPVADSVVVMSNNMIQLTESLPVADSVVVMSNNMIQLTESLLLSDDTIIMSNNMIQLTESLLLSDDTIIMSNNMIQLTESLPVADSVVVMSNNMIQLTESLSLSDDTIIMSNNMIQLTESLSLSDDTIIMSNNMIQLTESLPVADSVVVMSNNMIQLTESLPVADSVVVMSNNMIQLTESLPVADSVVVMSNNMIQLTESLPVADSVVVMSNNMIQLTESLSLSDDTIIMSNNMIQLTESLPVADSVVVMSNNMIQLTESLSLSDDTIIMSNNMIQLTESLPVADSVVVMSNNMIQLTESLPVADSVVVMSNNMIQLTESLPVADSVVVMSNNMIQLTESLPVADSVVVMSNNMIQLTESLSLSDDTIIMSNNMIQLTESLPVADSVVVMSNNMIQLTESLPVADSVVVMSNNMIQLTESLPVADSVVVMSNNMIQLTESLPVADSVVVMSNNMIQLTESLSLSDDTIIMSNNMIQLTESLSLSDDTIVMSNNMIQLTESLPVADSVVVMSNNMIQLTESLPVADSVVVMSNNMIQLTESLPVADSVVVMSNNMIQLTESLPVADSVVVMSNNMIQLTESLSLSDDTIIMSNNMIQLTESLPVADSVVVMSNNMIQLTESLPVADSVVVMSNNMIQLTESLPVADSVVVMSNNMIQLTESLPVADSVVVMSNNMIQLTESLPVADSVVVMSNNMIQLTESLPVADSVVVMSNNMIQLTESLPVADSVVVMSNNMIQLTESLPVADSVVVMSNNMIQLTESLSLSDDTIIMSNNMIQLTESLLFSDVASVPSGQVIIKILELLLISDHTLFESVLSGVSKSESVANLPYARETSIVELLNSDTSSSVSGSPHLVIDIATLVPSYPSESSTGLTITITTTRGDTMGLFSHSHGTLAVIKSTTDISRILDDTLVEFGSLEPTLNKIRASDYYIIDDISGNIVYSTISMEYTDSLINALNIDESTLTIYKRSDVSGSNWIALSTISHDESENIIVANNNGFSTVVLAGDLITAPIPSTTPTTPTPTTSITPTQTNRGGGGGGGGGGSSIRGPALESGQSAVLYEVSWDVINDDSTLLSIIAGPDSDAISIKIRTPESGVLYTQRAESQPYSDGDRVLYEATIKSSNDFVVVYVEAVSQRDVNVVQNLINLYDASGTVIITKYVHDDSSDVTPGETIQDQLETVASIDTPRIILDDLLKLLYITEYDGGNTIQYDYLTLQTVPDNYAKVYHNIDNQYTTAVSLINSQTGIMEIILQVSHTDDKVNSARMVYLGNEVTIKVSAGANTILVDSASMIYDVAVPDGMLSNTLYTTMNLKSQIAQNDHNPFKSVMSHMSITNENTAEQLKYYTILQQQPKTDNIKSYSVSAMPDRYGDVDGANSDLNLILVLYEGDDDSTVSVRIAHMGGDIMTVLSENSSNALPYTQSTEIPLYPNTSKGIMATTSCDAGDLELENGTCMTPEPGTFVCLPDQVMNHDGACIDK